MEWSCTIKEKGPKHCCMSPFLFEIKIFFNLFTPQPSAGKFNLLNFPHPFPLIPQLLLLQQLEELIQLWQDDNACPAVSSAARFS